MDTITQAVIGAAAGQAVGGRALGKKAALVGALAGWLPDADVLIRSAADPLLAIEQHRGFTHALAFIPVGAAIAALPFLATRAGRDQARPVYLAALAGWATHAPLDAFTSYGTQLLWPSSSARIAWNAVSIVDPLFTLPLLLGVVLAWRRRRALPAVAGLAWAAAWLGLGVVQHARAASVQVELARARGHEPVRARVDPSLGNNVLWRAIYVADGRIHADAVRVPWLGRPTVRTGGSAPLAAAAELAALPAAAPAATARAVRTWAWFTDGWMTRSDGPGGEVVVADQRYAADPAGLEPLWALTLRTRDPATPVARSSPLSSERGLARLWVELTGRDQGHRPPTEAVAPEGEVAEARPDEAMRRASGASKARSPSSRP
jgi:inner membrane protein